MPTVHIDLRGRNPLERILFGIVAAALLVLGFFFLAAALVMGALFAAVLVARVWWASRKIRKAAEREIIAAEYSVIEREGSRAYPRVPDRKPPGVRQAEDQ